MSSGMPQTRTVHYFAGDGNYGDAGDISIVETENWTDDDFDLVAGCSDWELPTRARIMAAYVRLNRPADFFTGDIEDMQVSPVYRSQIV
jgi:hypothetical protein